MSFQYSVSNCLKPHIHHIIYRPNNKKKPRQMSSSSIPIQRLIFTLASDSSSSSSSAANIGRSLIRNCRVPQTDIQIGNDRSLGFRGVKKHVKGKIGRKEFSRNRQFYQVDNVDYFRTWERPQFQDVLAELYCDRLMLGEPPVRSALVVPASESKTYDCLCRTLQLFQNLEPEDILFVVGNNNNNNKNSGNGNSSNNNKLYLGPIPDQMLNTNPSVAMAVEAIRWKFSSSENEEQKKHEEIFGTPNSSENDDDDPVQFVSCLFSNNGGVDSNNKSSDVSSSSSSSIEAFISALWCSHPEQAAIATKLYNKGLLYDTIFDSTSSSTSSGNINKYSELLRASLSSSENDDEDGQQEGKDAIGNDSDERGCVEPNLLSILFQFSMVQMKDEKILEAAKNPKLAKAVAPGVALNNLEGRAATIGERIQEKKQVEERLRKEGKAVLKKLMV